MEKEPTSLRLAGLLVRWRIVFFTAMALLGIFFATLIPRIRLNSDVTSNLPDESQMTQGLNLLSEEFPKLDFRMQTLRVLFLAEAPADSLRDAIAAIPEVTQMTGMEQNGNHTLYLFSVPQHANAGSVVAAVKERFGDRVKVELDDNSHIPGNLVQMMLTGFFIALVILLLMCQSFMEPLIFLLGIGLAVSINMSSNALLPSVFTATHSIAAILQLVLSMDFAIILMSRYRQEKQPERSNEQAMTHAIASAAPSILSSGLTTIVSLLMLCFMRLKIGADLGIVLSKGVFCSLIATFTTLPALILWFDKAITRTEKKMLRLPTDGLARFETRFHLPLSLLFVAVFIGSWFLQKQTVISYSVDFPTEITEEFPPKDNILILYKTADEEKFLPIADRLAAEPDIPVSISYPYLMLKPRTTSELLSLGNMAAASGFTDGFGDTAEVRDMLDLAYYAASHPQRDERMRMDELETDARELAAWAEKLMPEDQVAALTNRFDIDALMKRFSEEYLSDAVPEPELEEEPAPLADSTPETVPETPAPQLPAVDSLSAESPAPVIPAEAAPAAEMPAPLPADVATASKWTSYDLSDTVALRQHFAYDSILVARTSDEMAQYLALDPKYTSLIYRMARTGRKGRPNTMNTEEFVRTLSEKVLGNRLYAAMLSAEEKKMFRLFETEVAAILAAGPQPVEAPVDTLPVTPAEMLADATVPDSVATAAPVPDPAPVVETPPAAAPATPEPPSPLEDLVEMTFSGKRYTSAQVYRALNRVGLDISREELDLLFMYHGYKTQRDTTVRLTIRQLTDYLATLPFVQMPPLDSALNLIRGEEWSLAILMSDKPVESDETFAFLDSLESQCSELLPGQTYRIGYSVMYKEMKEGFPRELLLLTLLTVAAIFLIVALTFRSLVIPFLLVPTVLSAVWLNVYSSGLGGNTMLYISYLIVQSILMGATIDYSILFTHYYRECRLTMDIGESLRMTYRKSFYAILTSGFILATTPILMTYTVEDPMISSILKCISIGATAAILLIFFVLPSTLVLLDRWVVKKKK